MKRGFSILLVIGTIIVGISCSNSKSYTDYLNDQRDAIQKFIDEEGIEILGEYPKDGKFGPKQFVNMDGIYMNVIDSGNGDKATVDTRVYARASGHHLIYDTTYYRSNFENGSYPVEFNYGSVMYGSGEYYDRMFFYR